jgi:hypothetical protein
MKVLIMLLIFTAGFSGLVASKPAGNSAFDSIGRMPEIVVTAPRYEYEDVAWSGLMETIVVTAPPHSGEDMYTAGMVDRSNTPGTDKALFQTSVNNRDNNRSFRADINIMAFLGIMSLIIGVFLLLHFLRKYSKPTQKVCGCNI